MIAPHFILHTFWTPVHLVHTAVPTRRVVQEGNNYLERVPNSSTLSDFFYGVLFITCGRYKYTQVYTSKKYNI